MVALVIQSDHAHNDVRAFLRENREQLVLPSITVGEIGQVIGSRGGTLAEVRLLRLLAGGAYPLVEAASADYARAADFVERYADFPLGTVDALIAAMAERLGVTSILTLDRRHFGAIRPRHCERFTLVP